MEQDPAEKSRKQLLKVLLAKLAEENYPSTTMMDTIEELLTPDELDAYAAVLIGHIENDTYPSIPMISRLRDLTAPS